MRLLLILYIREKSASYFGSAFMSNTINKD